MGLTHPPPLSLRSCTFYAWVLFRVVSVLWSLTATLDLWLLGGFFDDWRETIVEALRNRGLVIEASKIEAQEGDSLGSSDI